MALCGSTAKTSASFPAVWGLWASASSRSGYADARKLAEQLVLMARRSKDPVHQCQARFALANTRFWQGEFAASLPLLDGLIDDYSPSLHSALVSQFGEDVGVTASAYRSWVLCFLGRAEEADAASQHSLALARELDHPFSLAYALTFAGLLRCRQRQAAEALCLAQESLALAEHHGYTLWQIGATLVRGWALAQQGDACGLELVRNCADMIRNAMGGVTLVTLEPLIDACVTLGQNESALATINEAQAIALALGDHHIDAELQRLKGEALLGQGQDVEQAEACFLSALSISRQQHSRAFELAAAKSLAQLKADVADTRAVRHRRELDCQ